MRIGLLVNSATVRAWQASCLRQLLAVDGVELALVVVNDRPPPARPKRGRLRRFASSPDRLWQIYSRGYLQRRSQALQRVDLSAELRGVHHLACRVERRGKWSEHFSEEDVDALRGYDLDALLRLGFGIIRGPVLEAARYGVWSFHHGDVDRYRGGPPAFWELRHGEAAVGAVLQRLTERLDAGVVLRQGEFPAFAQSYIRTLDGVLLGASGWAAELARAVTAGDAGRLRGPAAVTQAPIYRNPSDWQTAALLAQVGAARLRRRR